MSYREAKGDGINSVLIRSQASKRIVKSTLIHLRAIEFFSRL